MQQTMKARRLRQCIAFAFSSVMFAGWAPSLEAQLIGILPDQQSAAPLSGGGIEASGSYSYVGFSFDGEREHFLNQFGVRVGFGVMPSVEVRGAVEHMRAAGEGDGSVTFVAAGPKVGLVPGVLSVLVPVGATFGDDIESGDSWVVMPTLLATLRAGQNIELNPSARVIYPFTLEDGELLWGANLGAALSGDLSSWAVRPEVGIVHDSDQDVTFFQVTIGVSVRR